MAPDSEKASKIVSLFSFYFSLFFWHLKHIYCKFALISSQLHNLFSFWKINFLSLYYIDDNNGNDLRELLTLDQQWQCMVSTLRHITTTTTTKIIVEWSLYNWLLLPFSLFLGGMNEYDSISRDHLLVMYPCLDRKALHQIINLI